MKTLFLLTDRFPYNGACSSLLLKMLTEGALAEKMGQVHVLLPKYSKDDISLEKIENITVHRVLMPSFLPAKELRKMKTRPDVLLRGAAAKLWDRKVARRLRKDRFLQECFTKDLCRSIRKLHKKEKFQVLVPIAGAYEVAAAAMKVAKKEKIGLLLYQVDPCSTNISFSQNSQFAREQFEDELYRNADGVITTPILLKERQAAGKPDLEKATPMEFPNVSMIPITPTTRENPEKRICVFAGRVYHGIRNPKYTVSLFLQLNDPNTELHLYGVTEEELASFGMTDLAPGRIFCHGLCPLDVVQERIQQADIVVNMGNIMTNQVPSKIFEYISSCKPILNIATNMQCPSIPYMQRYPRALTLVEGEENIQEAVCRLVAFIKDNAGAMADQQEILSAFRECTAVHCGDVMAAAIEKICIKNGG